MAEHDTPAPHVLVIEEDPTQLARTSEILAATGMVGLVDLEQDPAAALKLMLAGHHDLCILGCGAPLPQSGVLLETARASGCKTPVILILSPDDECGEECVPALGAQDALYRDGLLPSALRRSIRQVLAKSRIQHQLESSQAQLHRHEMELERLKATLDAHAIVSITDVHGNITYVNDQFCAISGYERCELVGRNHRMLKSGRHTPAFYADMWERISHGHTWHGEVCNRRKDGSLYWVRATIVPFAGDDGLPDQYVSIRTDITAVKEAESRLRLLGKALEASVDGITIADAHQPDTPLIYANPAFERLTGYTPDETIGHNCRFLQGADTEQPGMEEIRLALREGRSGRALLRNYRRDGSLFWNDLSITPVLDEEGQVSHFVGVTNDVTARYDAERALRMSEERLRRSQVYANIGTWDWNIQTGELYWSERIGPLFGYGEVVETTYENFLNAVHPDDRQRVVDAVNACVEQGEKYDIEHRCVWPDGTERWLLERGDVTRDAEGRPLHMLGVVQDITDRKLAEQRLQASEASLANAQRIAHLGNWNYDLLTGDIQWSPEVYRIFGFEPGSIRPHIQTYYEWVHPEDRTLVQQAEARTLGEGRGEVVHRIIRPDGEMRHVSLIAEVFADERGLPLRMAGTVQDISALKRAEEAVRQSESNLSMAQRVAHLGSFDWNPVTDELRWSDEHYRLWGHVPGAVTPSYAVFRQGVHPLDLARLEGILQAALSGGRFYDCVHRICRPDGSERIIHGRGEVMFDETGRAVRMIGTVQDVTELKQAEAKLMALAERNRALMESALDGILVADLEGRLVDVNRHAEAMTGYRREQLLQMHASQLHPQEVRDQVATSFHNIRTHGHVMEHLEVERPDGTRIPVDISATLVSQDGDQFILGVFRDATERMERERQLLGAKQEADRANQAKSMFLSSMSHELRTPMNAILGFAQLLGMQRDLGEDNLENVEEILKAGRHLLELINEVLDLAKIDAGGLKLQLEPVGCCELLKESLNLVRSMAERHDIRLETDYQDCCPLSFQADRTRLKQVVINLLSNAIKYNRAEGTATLRLAHGEPGFARIEVSDTGEGISPELQQELFQPFHRLHGPEQGIEGHGIGLAISKSLIEAMGGHIGVASTPGVGSTFWVELPVVETVRDAAEGEKGVLFSLGGMQEDAPRGRAEATLLYVEDNLANLRLVQNLVAMRPGWKLIPAQTPELGLERAMFQAVDLILLDINLPGMDGYQVLEHLQAMEKTMSIPVVALTASATPEAISRGMSAGFRDYLTKPLDVGRFWTCMDAILQDQYESQLT